MSHECPLELISLVEPYYNEPHRRYHTFNHITRMFDDANTHNIKLDPSQQLAILFHDIIYTPGSNTNEFDSARLLKILEHQNPSIFRDNGITSSDVDIACNIIVDTINHIPTFVQSKVIIDLDLLGLADEYNDYLAAGERVRQEFCHMDDAWWKKGRIQFLDSFINRNQIFQTKYFGLFEDFAKDNLKRERATLV